MFCQLALKLLMRHKDVSMVWAFQMQTVPKWMKDLPPLQEPEPPQSITFCTER